MCFQCDLAQRSLGLPLPSNFEAVLKKYEHFGCDSNVIKQRVEEIRVLLVVAKMEDR